MKFFRCQYADVDCERGERIPQNMLISFINSEKRKIYKCPYCRGRIKSINGGQVVGKVTGWGRKIKRIYRNPFTKESLATGIVKTVKN